MNGKTISHYRIIEKLGEGGMGKVYLAEEDDQLMIHKGLWWQCKPLYQLLEGNIRKFGNRIIATNLLANLSLKEI